MQRHALKSHLFSHSSCDDDGNGDWTFYLCTLKIEIGNYPAGSKFASIIWDETRSIIVLVNDDGEEFIFEIKVSVCQQIPNHLLHNIHGDHCGCAPSEPSIV